ncbi:MAG TPA: hypothetical protein DDX85_02430 [Nitrospiraceae bacterium]|nr:hypothetical protein [Nitrospiraceae bacterium]
MSYTPKEFLQGEGCSSPVQVGQGAPVPALGVACIVFYIIAADIIVCIHFLWIVFLIFGALWGRRSLRIKKIHIGGIIFAILIQTIGWYCPLTYLEAWLRSMHDSSQRYYDGFIAYYVEKIVYIDLSPRTVFMMTISLALVSAWLYLKKPGKLKKQE